MKCNEIKKLLNPYIDNELSEEDTNRVKIHLQECIDCAEETSELDKVRQMIHELPRLKAPIELVEKVRDRIVNVKQPEVSIFLRYRWVIGSFASAAAVFLLVYITIINSYQYRDYPVRESVLKEQAKPGGLPTESESLTLRTAPMLRRGDEPAKDELIKSSDSSVAILAQNIRITTNDINETKDKIYEVANVTKGGFDGLSVKENKEGDVIGGKSVEKTTELRREASIKGKSQRSTISGFTSQTSPEMAKQSAQKSPQQYVVKVTIPLSKKDAFIQNLKSNISDQIVFSEMRVASTGTLMMSKALAEKITERDKELSELTDNESGEKKDTRTGGKVLLESDVAKNESKLSQGESSAAKPEDKENTIQPSAQPQTPASTPPEADLPIAQGSSKKAASEKTGATPPPPPSAPSTPSYSKEIAKNDAKDKSSDNESLRKQKDLLKAQETKDKGDAQIDGEARRKKGELSEKLDELQSSINEIMIEFIIIIEEKTK